MATRYYLLNTAAPYSPSTLKGGWEENDSVDIKIDTTQSGGSSTSVTATENQTTTNWDLAALRGVSDGLPYTQELSGTMSFALMARKQFNFDSAYMYLHIWVTQGDSNTPRGTLVSNYLDSTAMAQNPTKGYAATGISVNTVNVTAGDRIVVEMGTRQVNTSGIARGAVHFYGGTSGDVSSGSTDQTQFSWVEFSFDLAAEASGSGIVGGIGMGTNI